MQFLIFIHYIPRLISDLDLAELFVQTFRFNDFNELNSIEVPINTIKPIDFTEFLIPFLSTLPKSMRHITICLLMSKNSELEHIDWSTFIGLFTTPQFSTLDCVQLWVQNRPGAWGLKKRAALVKKRLVSHGAPSIFIVEPITNWDRDV